jgi:hypothetical protein
LHISGTGTVAEFLLSNTNFTSGNRNFNIWGNTNNGFWEIRTLADNFNSTGVIFANLAPLTGNILINKNSDSGEKLQIIGGGATALRLESNANVNALSIGGTGDLSIDAPGVIGGRFFVNNSGNVGIGINSPQYKLHILNNGNTLLQLNGNNTTGSLDTGFTISADDSKNIYLYQRENAAAIFGANNAERMRITSGGNLLVGTTTDAGYKLDVNGTGRFRASAGTYAGGSLILTSSAGTNPIYLTSNSGFFALSNGGSADNFLISSTGAATFSSSVTTTFLRVSDSAGQIGEINSSNANGGYIVWQTSGTTIADLGTAQQIFGAGGNDTFGINGRGARAIAFGTNNTERMRITSGGNVGIGTASPGAILHTIKSGTAISGVGDEVFIGQRSASTSNAAISIVSSNESIIRLTNSANIELGKILYDTVSNFMRFDTNSTERMRITSGGNVGIGSIPNFKLNVFDAGVVISSAEANWSTNTRGIMVDNSNNGDESVGVWFRTGGNHLSGISGQRTNSASDWSTDLRFYTHPSSTTNLQSAFERMRITSDGNVLIGTTTDVGAKLHVNGSVRTGAPSGGSAVDWRLGTARGGTITPNAIVRVEIDGVLVDLDARYV